MNLISSIVMGDADIIDGRNALSLLAEAGRLGSPLPTTEGKFHESLPQQRPAVYTPIDEMDVESGSVTTGAAVANGDHGHLVGFMMCPKGGRSMDQMHKLNFPQFGFFFTRRFPRWFNQHLPTAGGIGTKQPMAVVVVSTWHDAATQEEWSLFYRKSGCHVLDLSDASKTLREKLHATFPARLHRCAPTHLPGFGGLYSSHLVVVDTRTKRVVTRWGRTSLSVGVDRPDFVLQEWAAGRSGIDWKAHAQKSGLAYIALMWGSSLLAIYVVLWALGYV